LVIRSRTSRRSACICCNYARPGQKLNLIYQRYRLPPSVRDTINDTVTRGVASSANYM
jgi:hypothetical protein